MGADDEGGNSGNNGSHSQDAPAWADYAVAAGLRRVVKDCEDPSSSSKSGRASVDVAAAEGVDASDTTWKSAVDKWRAQSSTLSPRNGSAKRKTHPAQWHLQPQHRYDRKTEAALALSVDGGHRSPGAQSRSGLRTPQPAEEPDAESPSSTVSIDVESLVASTSLPESPAVAQALQSASPPVRTQTKRIMERAPLLRPLPSGANDPDWEFRYALEARPDTREEFAKLSALSYPVIVTYVLEFLPGIVSMTLVGHLESPLTKEYVGGVSLSTMFMNLTGVAFGFGLATAMDTLCAQAYGAGKPMKLGIYLQSGFIVLGVTVIPVFLLNWYTTEFLLWMGQPADVAVLAGRFSRLVLPGIPFLYAYELFKKLLQAQNVVLPMVFIAVLSNVVNIVLGVYLTFYTSLGYDGAAIARTVANVVLPGSLIPLFLWRPEVFRQWWPGWKLAQALQHLRAFLTLGIPGMFMMLLEWWSFEIMAAFVGLLPHSVVAISVHSVLVGVSTLTFNFFLGISVATNIRVGNYVGSNQPEHAKMAASLGMALALAVSALLAVVVASTRYVLPMVFINDETSVVLAGHALLFLLPYQLLDAVNSVMQGVFRGTGRNALGAYINLFAYFAIGLPFGLYLAFPLRFGVEGLWLGLTAGIFGGCCVSVYKIFATDWEDMADAARVRTS
ncbi:hypothetical protein PybrP1_004995 [[Pythium] brassicae (nom. inval.)]|nr:hypothetical protein PybrP1_004995 [[Pythium] brassicae (nom. inval.)]